MKKRTSPSPAGFTILELMVAVFILSITAYSLYAGLQAGDKIQGKAKASRAAALVASNEAERIRNAALRGVRLRDLEYADTVSGVVYTVLRKTVNVSGSGVDKNLSVGDVDINAWGIDFDAWDVDINASDIDKNGAGINITHGAVTEYEISVGSRYGPYVFRLLQGYH